MARPTIKEINCLTGEELVREMTVAEAKAQAEMQAQQEAKAQAKADALAALGLTEEQLQALLG
jgi:hypothetical protein